MHNEQSGLRRNVLNSRAIRTAVICAILVSCSVGSLHAQLTQQWVKTVDGPAHNDDYILGSKGWPNHPIVADSNDNSYITGSICLTAAAPPVNCTSSALLVVKY